MDEPDKTEVRATVSYGNVRKGDRLQVDIHDPAVAGLIKAGYLKIIWKGVDDAGKVDSAVDTPRPERVPAGRVDTRRMPEPEEEVDGTGGHRPCEEDSPST